MSENTKDANSSEGIILNQDNISPSLNEILSSGNTKSNINSEREVLPSINTKINETQPLSLNIMKKNNSGNISSVVQIPQSISSNDFKIDISNEKGTLDESIYYTIYRDLNLIYVKLKLVMNPFISKEKRYNQIRQWDLWGPLILNLFLACTLSLNTKEKGQITALIFIIFWLGGTIIHLNNYFLGVKASIFQVFCLLGYCLFPLNISAIIVSIIHFNDIIRLILVGLACGWSVYSSSDYLKVITNFDQRYLVLYPCILFYLYIAWFIFATKE